MLQRSFDRQDATRLFRFTVVGASNTLVALGLYALALGLGLSYPAAAVIGYGAGILNGYTWNRIWTFDTGAFHAAEFSRYVAVQGSGLLANMLGLVLAVETLGMGEVVAEVVVLLPITLATYWLNRRWTFPSRTPP